MKDSSYLNDMEDAAAKYRECFDIFMKYYFHLPVYIRKQIKTKLSKIGVDVE
tara:strand:- start:90 stop:245 length:156 start_codon:yes stop_codon:yes gene_type:complete